MPNKFSIAQRARIVERINDGETRVKLAAEFHVDESTIRRIYNASKGIYPPSRSTKPKQKPIAPVRYPEITLTSRPIKQPLTRLHRRRHTDGVIDIAKVDFDGCIAIKPPAPMYIPLAPLSPRIGPVRLVRKHGTAHQVTGHGSTIVLDADGNARRVLNCTAYYDNFRVSRTQDVEITSIDGRNVRGRISRLSGGTVSGTVVFEGIKAPDQDEQKEARYMVTRVVFYADGFPPQHLEAMAILRGDQP